MHRDRLERHRDYISGNFNDTTWPAIGREPTNQVITGRCSPVYFNVFPGGEVEGTKAQLNWLTRCVENGST